MKLSLNLKVSGFIVLLILALGMLSTVLYIYSYKEGINRELTARGVTMAESLAMSVDEGLASENLDLISHVQKISYADDVVLAQVFTTLWLQLDSYPQSSSTIPPDIRAIRHFEKSQKPFYQNSSDRPDFYCPVFFHQFNKSKDNKYVIGYVRIQLSSEQTVTLLHRTIVKYVSIFLMATVVIMLTLTMFVRKTVLRPLSGLQQSVSASVHEDLPIPVPVYGNDEIGELSRAFNEMCEGLRERDERLHEQTVQLEEEIGERQIAQEALQEQTVQLEEEVTERQMAQEALEDQTQRLEEEIVERKQAEEKLRIVFDAAQAGIIMVNSNGVITFVNRCMIQLYGFEADEMIGSSYVEHVHQDERETSNNLLQRLIRGEIESISAERHYLRKNSDDFWGLLSARRHLDDNGSLIAIITVITDITELRNARTRMGLNLHRLESLVNILQYRFESIQKFLDYALGEAIKLTESRIGYIYFYDETRHEFVLNSWSHDVMQECTVAEHQTRYALEKTGLWGEVVRQRRPIIENSYEGANPLKRGYPEGHVHLERFMTIPVFSGKTIVAVVGVANKAEDYDQTDVLHLTMLMDSVWKICRQKKDEQERDLLQQKFAQAQKMEAIGRLAGGVAHDFNNKLSVIMGYAELLKMKSKKLGAAEINHLDEILKASNHSCEITRKLLAFSRSEVISPHKVNLNSIIEDSRKSLGRLIGEDIKLGFKPAADLWPTLLDPTQVDQIIMNLAVNARDAMPDGGLLGIETLNVGIDESYAHSLPNVESGNYVQLSVSDTGSGMDKETLEHIFEPFFTTKDAGKGTGLGLATIFGIVSQNNGFIHVYSEVGFGTTFKIFFPRIELDDESSITQDVVTAAISGKGTILLVEDEESLRKMVSEILGQLGYNVLEAKSPLDAIEICKSKDINKIDLILTDVIMPGMNGKEMSDRILEVRPNTPVLYMSGYTADIISSKGILEESVHFIQKPFNLQKLSLKIREAIE